MAMKSAPLLGSVLVCAVLATCGAMPVSDGPAFDGRVRACASDPARLDAYMIAPACPPGIAECKASSNHCNFLLDTPAGVGLAWFSGYVEGWDMTGIVFARLARNSSQWSTPQLVSRQQGFSAQNPVLHADTSTGTLYAWHTRQPKGNRLALDDPVPSQERYGKLWLSVSTNWGDSWAPAQLWAPQVGSWGRNKLVVGLDGGWLLPMYNESLKPLGHQYEHSQLLRKAPGASVRSRWPSTAFGNSSYLVQPSVVRLRPGQPHLRAFFRDRRAEWIYTSVSSNDGSSWSQPEQTELPNNNAGIQAVVLDSGAVLVAFNDMQGQTKHNLRNKLSVALSDDGGASFKVKRVIEEHPGVDRLGGLGPTSCDCYSYPSVVQTADGKIRIGYTYQRRTIKVTTVDERWIRSNGPLCNAA